MNKNPYVLKALKILGLEEMLKLAEILKSKHMAMKKAAGEDLVVWNEPSEEVGKAQQKMEGKVLSFKPKNFPKTEQLENPTGEAPREHDQNESHFTSSELMLWQKELTKESEVSLQKQDAINGYKKSAEMYVIKTELNGKEKLKIASTQGVLVNKKQA